MKFRQLATTLLFAVLLSFVSGCFFGPDHDHHDHDHDHHDEVIVVPDHH